VKFTHCAAALFFLLVSSSPGQDSRSPANPDVKPSAVVNLSAIGYRPPSRLERLAEDTANETVNFLDADHVLLTFNPRKMLKRLPSCPPEHDDRIVHAAVLEIPSGKVIREADWYLHDHRRYLWPLSPGKLLLRRGRELYSVDSALHETLRLSSPRDLVWVSITPDGTQIVVETARDAKGTGGGESIPRPSKSESKKPANYLVEFLDTATMAPQRAIPSDILLNLDGSSAGYVDLVHKGDLWLVRFGPNAGHRRNVARVRSQTPPSVVYSSNNALVIGRCALSTCDYSASSYTVTGRRLWQQHWGQYRAFPAVERSSDSSRFGLSTLRVAVPSGPTATDEAAGELNEAVEPDGFRQDIQVFETASGKPVLSVQASPPVMSGQNFSLSLDGLRMAVLHDGALQLFDLPPMSAEEQTKFSALRNETSGLYTLASTPDTDESSGPAAIEPIEKKDRVAEDEPSNTGSEAVDSNSTGAPGQVDSTAAVAKREPISGATPLSPAEMKQDNANELVATFRVTTKAVVIDVVVTDAKGRPIRGLRPQDFQLAEDGKPQEVRYFKEFSSGEELSASLPSVASPAAPSPAAAKATPNVFSNETHTPEAGAVTLILFDLLNTPSADQDYARQQLIKFLQTKPKNAQFALCTLSEGGSKLRLLQGFTQDENQLLAAVRGKKGSPKAARWQAGSSATQSTVGTVGDLASGGPTSGFQGLLQVLQGMQAEQQGTDTDDRSGATIDSLMLLARYLSGIPGRKNVVWLSGSFPISLVAAASSNSPSLDNRNYTAKIKRVTNLLAEAQVAVYPVDVRGLLGGGVAANTSGGMGGPSSVDPVDFSASSVLTSNGGLPQGMQALAQEAAERDTLTQFATDTGGKAFYNTNGIREAIATASEQGSNYYTLSYSPLNKNFNGKFRRIKVQLAEKGYGLHYRRGYFADDANTVAKDADLVTRTRAVAMQHGSPSSRQVLFKVQVAPVGTKKKVDRATVGEVVAASTKKPALPALVEVQHYSIDYLLDGSEVGFTPQENSFRSVLTLMVTSFNSAGEMLTGIAEEGRSNLDPEVYKNVIGGDFHVHQEVDVPVEATSLRLGIQDQTRNHLGTVEIPLPVPPLPNTPRRIKDPLPEIEPD
jgi:VWFA-related protein